MTEDPFRQAIERGELDEVRRALDAQPSLANRRIRWYLNQQNESDPLHFVCDSVGHGWLTNGHEGEIAAVLLAHGAALNGSKDHESPLIAAASLGAPKVARVLIDAGADLERVALFGARALHWAAWTGDAAIVGMLVDARAKLEESCAEFGATPLFWAVHGYGPHGCVPPREQVEAARILIGAGARVDTVNKHGATALEQAKLCANQDMYELLKQA